jgi:hypothetical protein
VPNYLFENPKNGKVSEVFFHMKDEKTYIVDGVKWNRVYTVPQASIDTRADPYNQKDFSKVTNKKGTYGDLLDRSNEMSLKREEKEGVDPVKQKYFEDYSKKRAGLKHPDQKKQEANQKLKNLGVRIR